MASGQAERRVGSTSPLTSGATFASVRAPSSSPFPPSDMLLPAAAHDVPLSASGTVGTSRAIWTTIAAMLVLATAWLALAGIDVARRGLLIEVGAAALLGAVAIGYGRSGRSAAIAGGAEASSQLIAIGALMETLSYLVTRAGGPLRDVQLAALDRALGFDWDAWTAFVHARPAVAWTFATAYNSLIPQLAACVLYLGLRRRAEGFLWMMVVSGALTIAISGVMPAIGHLPSAPHVADFLALRADTLREIDPSRLQGLISFPSYHAALAVLVAVVMWHDRLLRWPAVALNGVMVVATISEGGHYLVDVVAGIAIAAGSAALVRQWIVAAPRAGAAA